jgi:ribonucleoside-diphosphate reductase alpha chain
MALNNCGAVDTKDDIVHAAEWTMDALMNGVGVGFSTYWRGVCDKPDKLDNEVFKIPDSREGWVNSVINLLTSYIYSKKYGKNKYPVFDYSLIRKSGERINGFGGISSGPEPLKKLHIRLEKYLDAMSNRNLVDTIKSYKEIKLDKEYDHTRFVADVFNAIGACVVAGNVRRSAQIALGNTDDDTFLNLKNYTENPERSEIGWMSNNSIVLESNKDFEDFSFIPNLASRIIDNGEPGIINLYNIQKFGRYGKELKDDAYLVNPCSEISLQSFELCNLSEVFPNRCKNLSDFENALRYATFYSSTVSLLPTHRPETNAIIAKNRRIGVSISGIAQWVSFKKDSSWGEMNYTRMTQILRNGYHIVKNTNKILADLAGIPSSIRLTAIKPSGSISLLSGSTSGIHYPVSRYAIRRIRIADNSPLIKPLIDANIPHEKDIYSDNTLVFDFTIDHGDLRSCDQVSPWEQFSLVAMFQRCWSDNMVSATIYFDKEKDVLDVEKMLAMYIPILKSVSMLPHSGHGYKQAPYEPINKDEYEKRLKTYILPNFKNISGIVPEGSNFCTSDNCDFISTKNIK